MSILWSCPPPYSTQLKGGLPLPTADPQELWSQYMGNLQPPTGPRDKRFWTSQNADYSDFRWGEPRSGSPQRQPQWQQAATRTRSRGPVPVNEGYWGAPDGSKIGRHLGSKRTATNRPPRVGGPASAQRKDGLGQEGAAPLSHQAAPPKRRSKLKTVGPR